MTNVFVIAHHTRAEVGSLVPPSTLGCQWLVIICGCHQPTLKPTIWHLASDRDASDADIGESWW